MRNAKLRFSRTTTRWSKLATETGTTISVCATWRTRAVPKLLEVWVPWTVWIQRSHWLSSSRPPVEPEQPPQHNHQPIRQCTATVEFIVQSMVICLFVETEVTTLFSFWHLAILCHSASKETTTRNQTIPLDALCCRHSCLPQPPNRKCPPEFPTCTGLQLPNVVWRGDIEEPKTSNSTLTLPMSAIWNQPVAVEPRSPSQQQRIVVDVLDDNRLGNSTKFDGFLRAQMHQNIDHRRSQVIHFGCFGHSFRPSPPSQTISVLQFPNREALCRTGTLSRNQCTLTSVKKTRLWQQFLSASPASDLVREQDTTSQKEGCRWRDQNWETGIEQSRIKPWPSDRTKLSTFMSLSTALLLTEVKDSHGPSSSRCGLPMWPEHHLTDDTMIYKWNSHRTTERKCMSK